MSPVLMPPPRRKTVAEGEKTKAIMEVGGRLRLRLLGTRLSVEMVKLAVPRLLYPRKRRLARGKKRLLQEQRKRRPPMVVLTAVTATTNEA